MQRYSIPKIQIVVFVWLQLRMILVYVIEEHVAASQPGDR